MSHNDTELAALEAAADNQYNCQPLPHPASTISKWHLLTSLEDMLRMPFLGKVHVPSHIVGSINDRSKYGLRHALNLIIKKSDKKNDISAIQKKVTPSVYGRAISLLKQGIEYERICGFSSAVHSSHAELAVFDGRTRLSYAQFIDARYGALELMRHGQEPFVDVSTLLFAWLRREATPPAIVSAICESVSIKNKRINYEYGHLALPLVMEFSQRPITVPDELIFPWGSANNTLALINSLLVRCAYHIIAVNEAAGKMGLSGGCEASLVLSSSKEDLCRDISLLADVGDSNVIEFVNHLTYGYKTSTPDPALQPIIPAKGALLLPCLHTLTCDIQRNILALHTRIHSKDFDRQSHLFEKKMTEDIRKMLQNYPIHIFNRKLSSHKIIEEFDAIIVDPLERKVLLMELRWVLQPGDPREVANKMKECNKKVSQIKRKTDFFKKNFSNFINKLFPDLEVIAQSDWSIDGIVVLEGFGGILSSDFNYPIVPSPVLNIGLKHIKNLTNLQRWIQSLDWLPQEGVHFDNAMGSVQHGDIELCFPGINLTESSKSYREHIIKSASSYS